MKIKILPVLAVFALLTSAWTQTVQAGSAAAGAASEPAAPEGRLNPDGSINLDTAFTGTLDLSGWNVELDPARGPVFRAAGAASTPEHWTALGEGGGAVDDVVYAIVVDGTDVYIGGAFTDLANLPAADYVAKWDGTDWSALSADSTGNGAVSSYVYSLALSGTDLYVGGTFVNVSNAGVPIASADYIARWDTTGGSWSAVGSNGAGDGALGSYVNQVALSGTDLYVVGSFTNVNNNGTVLNAADYVAKWDGTDWSALGGNGAGDGSFAAGSYISSLAVSGTDVYVGGNFTDVNNGGTVITAADRVAHWDGADWSAMGSNGAGNGSIGGTVYSLAVSGSDVYVGGQFGNVNNGGTVLTAADYLARWDGANWSALGSNGAGGGSLNNVAYAIFVNGPDVYVGGTFTNVNSNGTALPTADYLAKWDGTNWSAIGNNGAGDGAIPPKGFPAIRAVALQGGALLAGGYFLDMNDGGTVLPDADHLARWDGADWSALGTVPNGALVSGYASNRVSAIAVIGTDVYVAGLFTDISNHGVNIPEGDNIAKWDGSNWSALGSNGAGDGSVNLDIYALAVRGTDLYVGGRFTDVNNNGVPLPEADCIARWDTLTSNWSALGSDGAGNGSFPSNCSVQALAVSGSNLYAGGAFANVNNGGTALAEADNLARWDGANWSALGSNGAGDGALGSTVSALLLNATGDLYAGGAFTNAGGNAPADYLARWDGANWSALGSNGAGDGALNSGVSALALSGGVLYAGGSFTNVNNGGIVIPEADYIAYWDGADWAALGSNGAGNGSLNAKVNAILINGSEIIVGGHFTNVNNGGAFLTAADRIAKWDGADWSALGSDGAGNGSLSGYNDFVRALQITGAELLVGGQFSNVNDSGTLVPEADYLAAYGLGADLVPPAVLSISRANASPTAAPAVDYLVTFSESVTGLDPTDFSLVSSGITGAGITGISGAGSHYTVHVATGAGSGSLRLDLADNDSVHDPAGNPLGGAGAGNGSFTGETYQIIRFFVYLPVVIRE